MSRKNKRSISEIDVHDNIEESKCKKSKCVSDILSIKRESKYNCLTASVLSPLSDNIYDVSISIDYLNRDFKFICTCGYIFGKAKRNKCKHIDFVKSTILNKLTKKDFTEYFGIDNLSELSIHSTKNILAIPVSSETSESEYEVYLNMSKENITCQCSCGMKFGIGLRNKCKHISHIIYSLVNKVSDNEELSQTKIAETLKELGI